MAHSKVITLEVPITVEFDYEKNEFGESFNVLDISIADKLETMQHIEQDMMEEVVNEDK